MSGRGRVAARLLPLGVLVAWLGPREISTALATLVPLAGSGGAGAAPEYDLAIVKVDATLRWQGGLEELARFDVFLANRGARAIEREQVECMLAGRTFRGLDTGRLLRPGEVYPFTVQVKGREVVDLPAGRHAVECAASIVAPAHAHDAVPENDRAAGFVTVQAPPKPDLAPQALAVRDCDTLAPAVAGRPICLEVTLVNLGGGFVAPWTVACDLGGTRVESPGPAPLDRGAVDAVVLRFAPQPAGERAAECTLDEGDRVDERDEENNRMRGDVFVLADTAAARYDLAVTAIEAALTEVRDRDTNRPSVVLGVRIENPGAKPVLAADIRCEVAGTDLVLSGSTAGAIAPGGGQAVRVQAEGRRLASVPAGRYETTCVAGIVQPSGVVETDVANNALTAAVVVKR